MERIGEEGGSRERGEGEFRDGRKGEKMAQKEASREFVYRLLYVSS